MTDKPPPWFDKQNPDSTSDEFKRRKAALLKQIPSLLDHEKRGGRAQRFMPYLLVRSVLGDRGDRPINVPFWESPDIWTAPGDPAAAPAVPPDHGGVVTAGQPATVYAHVWNLGFAPLSGVRVEFYWFDPSVSIDGTHAHLIGMARCELAGRGMAGSHTLVKCPTAWTPSLVNGGHECLVVRIEGVGDPIGGNPWAPWLNRHVAQRNISVVQTSQNIAHLIASLNASRLRTARLQLVQVGAAEAHLALKITAPHLKLAAVDTHVLGEISVAGALTKVAPTHAPPAVLAPVHVLTAGGAPPAPALHPEGVAQVIHAQTLGELKLSAAQTAAATARVKAAEARTAAGAHLADLLGGITTLNDGHQVLAPPKKGEAQVIRVASYAGTQLVGGYTIVVAGA
ncbi:MAG TPA: hypothetical protein VGI95_00605 [Caulobacteraceae bacterium]|jgi:hypothetical protein